MAAYSPKCLEEVFCEVHLGMPGISVRPEDEALQGWACVRAGTNRTLRQANEGRTIL
jgi:hypothetical protein